MEKVVAAFDIGDKRVGVAFTDPFGEYAVPSDTYFRTGNLREDVEALLKIVKARGAECVVCGLPVNADGTPSVQTKKTERFLAELRAAADIPVETEDERYTTREAREDLCFLGVSAKKDKKKKSVDSLAAAYLLERYLARKKGDTRMKEDRDDYDEENNIVELVDDEGVTHRFEHLMTFEYRGEWYCAFAPEEKAEPVDEDEEDEGEEVAIFHLVGEENDETLETIEDDELLDEVFAEFCNLWENSEDADEAAELDGGTEEDL